MSPQSEQEKSTHLVFDGRKIVVSPDITPVMIFLMEIEKEIDCLLNFQEKLEDIKDLYRDSLQSVISLSEKLKAANIEPEYGIKGSLQNILEKFNFVLPLRVQLIALFASLEVLYFLDIAYNQEIDNDNKMRCFASNEKNIKIFLNSLVLSIENEYYKNNKNRLSRITAKKLRNLRNALTHFFSLPKLGFFVVPENSHEKAQKLEALFKLNGHKDIIFISPKDLYELIKFAHILRLKGWNDDFYSNKDEFKRKFQFVINLVKEYGAVSIIEKQLNL